MIRLLASIALLAAPEVPRARVLSVCLDDVSKEFLSEARTLGKAPNLQRFIESGLTFDHVFTAPICSPSRARFLLGDYHTGVGNNFKPGDPLQWSMDPADAFPHALPGRKVHVGKWHLAGTGDLAHPLQCGFDAWLGSFRNLDEYDRWVLSTPVGEEVVHEYASEWTARVAREALPVADFLNVNMNAAHAPLHAPPDRLHSFGDLTGADKKTLSLAMLEAADTVLGPLVDEALARGFVVFLWADNGGPVWGMKGTMHESAVNTWLVVVGDGVLPGRSPALVDQVDFAATFSEIMGGTFGTPDSRSFAPVLRGAPRPGGPREWTYCEIYDADRIPPPSQRTRAIRDRRWKLVVPPAPGAHELYDLDFDPDEEINLWPSSDPVVRKAHELLLGSMPE